MCAYRLGDVILLLCQFRFLCQFLFWCQGHYDSLQLQFFVFSRKKTKVVGPSKLCWSFRSDEGLSELCECWRHACYAVEERRETKILKNLKGTPWPWLTKVIRSSDFLWRFWPKSFCNSQKKKVAHRRVSRQVFVPVSFCGEEFSLGWGR